MPVPTLSLPPPVCRSTEWLALTWRERLTRHLHCCYCQGQHAYYFLQLRQGGKQEQAAAAREQQRLQAGAGERADEEQQPGPAAAAAAVDNPDQRIAADAAELCECLSAVVRVAAAAPFKLLYYRQAGCKEGWGARLASPQGGGADVSWCIMQTCVLGRQ